MYISSIKFKRDEISEWESGFYVGETDNCENSVILDSRYKPVEKDEDGCSVWDYRETNRIHLRF